jgi:hypothetical protein
MTDHQVIAMLAGIVIASALTWVRTALADRRDTSRRDIIRAKWEGEVTATLSALDHRLTTNSDLLSRIDDRLQALPCDRCDHGGALRAAMTGSDHG